MFPNFPPGTLDHLLGASHHVADPLPHGRASKQSIKTCVAVVSAITFRNRHRARDPYSFLSRYRAQGTALSNLNEARSRQLVSNDQKITAYALSRDRSGKNGCVLSRRSGIGGNATAYLRARVAARFFQGAGERRRDRTLQVR